jgi:hypothetical protein
MRAGDMHKKRIFTICLLTAVTIVGCTLNTTAKPTRPSSVTIFPTKSPTATPAPTATPTPIPTPQGAGLSENPPEVEFLTGLSDLPPGEYLLFRVSDYDYTNVGLSPFKYASLNGMSSDPLFTVSGRYGYGFLITDARVQLFSEEDNYSEAGNLLFVDMETQEVRQFNAGCGRLYLYAGSSRSFAYSCDLSGEVWHVLSLTDWTIRGYLFPTTFGTTDLRWIKPDLAIIENSANDDSFAGEHPPIVNCLLHASLQKVDCFQDVPPWWGLPESISPDGQWFTIRYTENDGSAITRRAIFPLTCLEDPSLPDCTPLFVPDADANITSSTRLFVDWTPDGSQIIFVDADGLVTSKTTIWSYDLASGQSRVLATYPGTDVFVGPWTSDGVHFLLIDGNMPGNQFVWLVSSATGQMRRGATGVAGIADVVGLFQVP